MNKVKCIRDVLLMSVEHWVLAHGNGRQGIALNVDWSDVDFQFFKQIPQEQRLSSCMTNGDVFGIRRRNSD